MYKINNLRRLSKRKRRKYRYNDKYAIFILCIT